MDMREWKNSGATENGEKEGTGRERKYTKKYKKDGEGEEEGSKK
jgi:hypothetical protein